MRTVNRKKEIICDLSQLEAPILYPVQFWSKTNAANAKIPELGILVVHCFTSRALPFLSEANMLVAVLNVILRQLDAKNELLFLPFALPLHRPGALCLDRERPEGTAADHGASNQRLGGRASGGSVERR